MEISDDDLDALDVLVQLGLADVVAIENGEPFYTLGARFVTEDSPR